MVALSNDEVTAKQLLSAARKTNGAEQVAHCGRGLIGNGVRSRASLCDAIELGASGRSDSALHVSMNDCTHVHRSQPTTAMNACLAKVRSLHVSLVVMHRVAAVRLGNLSPSIRTKPPPPAQDEIGTSQDVSSTCSQCFRRRAVQGCVALRFGDLELADEVGDVGFELVDLLIYRANRLRSLFESTFQLADEELFVFLSAR